MSNETIIETVEETVEEVLETIEEVVDNSVEALEESIGDLKQKLKGIPETDENNVIGSSRTTANGGKKFGAITQTENGAIGSGAANKSPKVKAVEPKVVKKETVALFSTRNVLWEGVGKIDKGYNIVDKAEAEKWLKRDHVRTATPEEVAEEYGI
jgi:ectoine hydroxylase-related dioxygenase (phytanoyl-CoA dioxygenase family)